MISFPAERQTVLVIHPNAVATVPISLEGLKPVAGGAGHIQKVQRHIE
jgi:hypothetical protein